MLVWPVAALGAYTGWPRLDVDAQLRAGCEANCTGFPECWNFANNRNNPGHTDCPVCTSGPPYTCEAPKCSYFNQIDISTADRPAWCEENRCVWTDGACVEPPLTLSQFLPDAALTYVGDRALVWTGDTNYRINNRRRVLLDTARCDLTGKDSDGRGYRPADCPPVLSDGVLELVGPLRTLQLKLVPTASDRLRQACRELGHTNGVTSLGGQPVECFHGALCVNASGAWSCGPPPCAVLDETDCTQFGCTFAGVCATPAVAVISADVDCFNGHCRTKTVEGRLVDMSTRLTLPAAGEIVVSYTDGNATTADAYWDGTVLKWSSGGDTTGINKPTLGALLTTTATTITATTITATTTTTTTGCHDTGMGCDGGCLSAQVRLDCCRCGGGSTNRLFVATEPPIRVDLGEDNTAPWYVVGGVGTAIIVLAFLARR